MKLSVVIPHYYSERTSHLALIARSLQAGTVPPDEIIIWNNDAPFEPIPGVRVIQADRNYGCLGRFIASYAARGEYVMFHDNDMLCHKTTAETLLAHAHLGLVSVDGWSFTETRNYRDHMKTIKYGHYVKTPTPVDVTPGHIELLSRATLQRILAVFPFEDSTIMEDLWFNACAQRVGVPRLVVPSRFGYLPSMGVGISHSDDFMQQRDELCEQIFS